MYTLVSATVFPEELALGPAFLLRHALGLTKQGWWERQGENLARPHANFLHNTCYYSLYSQARFASSK